MAPHEVIGLVLVAVGVTMTLLRRDPGFLALGSVLSIAGCVATWLPELAGLVTRASHFDLFDQTGMSPTQSAWAQKFEVIFYLALTMGLVLGLFHVVRSALLRQRK